MTNNDELFDPALDAHGHSSPAPDLLLAHASDTQAGRLADYHHQRIDPETVTVFVKDDTLVLTGDNFLCNIEWKARWSNSTHQLVILRRVLPKRRPPFYNGETDLQPRTVYSILGYEGGDPVKGLLDLDSLEDARALLARIQQAVLTSLGFTLGETPCSSTTVDEGVEVDFMPPVNVDRKGPMSVLRDYVTNGIFILSLLACAAFLLPIAFGLGMRVVGPRQTAPTFVPVGHDALPGRSGGEAIPVAHAAELLSQPVTPQRKNGITH